MHIVYEECYEERDLLGAETTVPRVGFDIGSLQTWTSFLFVEENGWDNKKMSFVGIFLISFLVGSIAILLIAAIIRVSYKRYRRELVDSGGAQTTFGKIGGAVLEGETLAQVLIAIYIGIFTGLMYGGGVALLFFYLGFNGVAIGLFGPIIVVIVHASSGPGFRARSIANGVLRSYRSHRDEEILRLELRKLKSGGETQLKAFYLISKRGCKASLVAKEIANESTVS